VSAVAARLRRLEQRTHVAPSSAIRVFWPEQLIPCREHPRCDVELETGAHHAGVIHLSVKGPAS